MTLLASRQLAVVRTTERLFFSLSFVSFSSFFLYLQLKATAAPITLSFCPTDTLITFQLHSLNCLNTLFSVKLIPEFKEVGERTRVHGETSWQREHGENSWQREHGEDSWQREHREDSWQREHGENSWQREHREDSWQREHGENSWQREHAQMLDTTKKAFLDRHNFPASTHHSTKRLQKDLKKLKKLQAAEHYLVFIF